ncbi:MAG: hypothetical protein ACKOEY_03815, partial [Phenylobacterium sp.]
MPNANRRPARTRPWIAGLAAVLSFALGGGLFTPGAVAAPTPPFQDMRYAAVVVDAETGEVLFSRRGDSLRYPASITKVMTLYLT